MAKGAVERGRGNLDDAEASFSTALGFLASAERLVSHENAGFAYWWRKRFFSKILIIRSEIGLIMLEQGRLVEAEALLHDTADFYGDGVVDVKPGLYAALFLGRVSDVFTAQNRYLEAQRVAELVLKIYTSHCAGGGIGAAETRERLARAQLALGNDLAAVKTYAEMDKFLFSDKKLLDLKFGDSLARALNEILSGDFTRATSRLKLAKDRTAARFGLGTPREAVITGLQGLLNAHQGNISVARTMFEQSIDALHKTQRVADARDGWLKRYITNGYLNLLQKSGEPRDIAKAFEIVQTLENGTVQQALRQNAARAGANNPELAALIRREQDLGQQIDALRRSLNAALSSPDEKIRESGDRIKNSLPTLFQAQKALTSEIAAKFPEFDDLINPRPLSVARLQSFLPDDGAVIVVRTAEDSTQVWAIPKEGDLEFKTVPLGRIQLSDTVAKIRKAVDPGAIASLADIPAFDTALAYELYSDLLAPVSDIWKPAKSLYVVAQGPLGQLPMSLLVTTEGNPANDNGVMFSGYRNVDWLANTHAVTVLPSVGAIAAFNTSRPSGARRPLVGFGDPFFSAGQALAADTAARALAAGTAVEVAQNTTTTRSIMLRSKPQTRSVESADLAMLPRLPDTRPELLGIAKSLGANENTDLYLGLRATEQQVKSMDLTPYNVIAFATHGLVPGDLNGLHQPALALSAPGPSKSEGDGLLTMSEILGLRLNADWAVLSACNTAAADGEGAEAISGLGRAFFYAGARALLVSSWPVHSGATTELTTTLFGLQTKNSNLIRAEALRQTRQHLIQNAGFKSGGKMLFTYAHPIFWAPFIIVGDGGGAAK